MKLETRNGLSAPPEFWELDPAELKEISNG